MPTPDRPRSFDESAAVDAALVMFWSKGFKATGMQDSVKAKRIGLQSLSNARGDQRGRSPGAMLAAFGQGAAALGSARLGPDAVRRAIAGVVAVLALNTAPSLAGAGPVPYVLDDGSGGFTIGPSQFDAVMTWGNAFVAVPGGETITAVLVSFGDLTDNTGQAGSDVVTIAILDDPDEDPVGRLDPGNAVLRSVSTGVWQDTLPSGFVRYEIAPTVVSGSFFVAVQMEVLQRANPARMDQDTPGVGSWLYFSPEPVLSDLGQAPFALRMSESPFMGTWMVRAEGVADAGCGADFDGDGAATVFDILAYLGAWTAGDPSAERTDDDALTVFDILAFLNEWDAGCP